MTSRFVSDLNVRQATHADIPAVERLGVPYLEQFDEFQSMGGQLWLGETPEGLAVAFWIFDAAMPLYPRLDLPKDTVALEHTTVSTEIRGLGYGPAAVTEKLCELAEAGYKVCVTKIADTNRVSLRSAARIGFHPTALMYQRRTAGRTRTIVEAWTPFARHLAEAVGAPGATAAPSPVGRDRR